MAKNDKMSGYQAPAVQKAFQLLALVAKSNKGIGTSEIAKTLGFSKGTTFGLTQALLKLRVLNQNPRDKKFYLGPAMVELSLSSWNYLKIRQKAQPILDALRDITGETVFLGARSQDRSLIIATAEAKKPIKITSPEGTTIPLLAGAVGKVFLSLMDQESCAEFIQRHGLRAFTPRSITDGKVYLAALEEVRSRGYALDNEEYMPGVKAIAAGIGNLQGLPLAVWVVGFANAMGDVEIDRMVEEVKRYAQNLRVALGD